MDDDMLSFLKLLIIKNYNFINNSQRTKNDDSVLERNLQAYLQPPPLNLSNKITVLKRTTK